MAIQQICDECQAVTPHPYVLSMRVDIFEWKLELCAECYERSLAAIRIYALDHAPILGIDGMNMTRADQPRTIAMARFDRRMRDDAANRSASEHHLTSVDLDLESVRRGGSCRKATCTCGWRGHERATITMAADDSMVHESGGTMSLGEIPIDPGEAVKDTER